MRQRWAELLFLHWAWDPAAVQRTLPPGLTVDTFDGRAWLGVVPFFMRAVRPAGLPAVPGVSDFLELNVRTYVYDAQGRPGVWFYSLDANRWLAVEVARRWFHLPYEHAAMAAERVAATGEMDYAAQRCGQEHESRFLYGAASAAGEVAADTREFFLVERYRLFAHDARRGRLLTGRVAHAPYRVAEASVPVWDDGPLRLAGFEAEGRAPDHRCVAEAVDVEVFPLEPVGEPARDFAGAEGALGATAAPA
jgi:uncharacterized protein YqjF (DUF2071 family)